MEACHKRANVIWNSDRAKAKSYIKQTRKPELREYLHAQICHTAVHQLIIITNYPGAVKACNYA